MVSRVEGMMLWIYKEGIEFGPLNRTHEGERPFMKMLWRKVRQGFRRYMPKGKLRK